MLALLTLVVVIVLVTPVRAQNQDPGWPREITHNGAQLVMYQPQVDEWKDFKDLQWRMAVSLTPQKGAKPILGAASMHADTLVDQDNQMVVLANIKLTHANFPGLDPASADKAAQLLQSFIPVTTSISLQRIVASTPKPETAPAVEVRNDPPTIFVSTTPALLIFVDGKPVRGKIAGTGLEFVVNASVPVLFDSNSAAFYLLAGEQWMTARALQGPWSATRALPVELGNLAKDPQWAELGKYIPAKANPKTPVPQVLYSETPAEVVLFKGKPDFKRITATRLLYATNTESIVFMHEETRQYYYLSAGRWFRAATLQGPWTYATMELPADFKKIPPTSPAGRVLAAVPGTEEAKDAVLMAQVPTTLVVAPDAAAKINVTYDGGAPKFEPITGTSLQYAVNTADKVIRVGDVYYLCLQGVWFMSTTAQGPWQVAPSVPQAIYTIPPSSPVYNVTYVTQVTTPSGVIESTYTPGYMGAFIVGAAVGYTVAYGTGHYYPPYYYYPPVGYPVYRPYPTPYGAPIYTASGAYGWGQAAYGPYGGAARAATYNPYTGTYARGATAYGPYGSRSAAQAYNPYTGTYAATRQGSSPTAQWGSSVVSKGGQTAYAQHYTTAAGTVGSVQTSQGGKVVAANTPGAGGAAVGRTAGGDYYATKDGNVYRNTGSGWQSYDNGNWNSAQQPQPRGSTTSTGAQRQAPQRQQNTATTGQPKAAMNVQPSTQAVASAQPRGDTSSQMQGLQQEQQARQRGSYQSQQEQRAPAQRTQHAAAGGGRRR